MLGGRGQRQGLWREEEEYKGYVSEIQQVEEKRNKGGVCNLFMI